MPFIKIKAGFNGQFTKLNMANCAKDRGMRSELKKIIREGDFWSTIASMIGRETDSQIPRNLAKELMYALTFKASTGYLSKKLENDTEMAEVVQEWYRDTFDEEELYKRQRGERELIREYHKRLAEYLFESAATTYAFDGMDVEVEVLNLWSFMEPAATRIKEIFMNLMSEQDYVGIRVHHPSVTVEAV